MKDGIKVTAVILAAGSSTRFGSKGMKKQFISVGGKSIVRWSIEGLMSSRYVDEVIAVLPEGDKCPDLPDGVKVVSGGATRLESVANGIAAVDEGLVVVHDGNRPMVYGTLVDSLIDDFLSSEKSPVVGVCYDDMRDSVMYRNGTYINRDEIVRCQTPSVVWKSDAEYLLANHACSDWNNLWELAYAAGWRDRILFHRGDPRLFKITVAEDLFMIKGLLPHD